MVHVHAERFPLKSTGISARTLQNQPRTPGLFETLRREMRLRNYSHKTIKAYVSCIRLFARHIHPNHPRQVNASAIREYLLYLMQSKHYSAATINQVLNALRFLYVELYKLPFVLGEIHRPKTSRKLPVVLSSDEVRRIFDAVENQKHKTVLMMIYSKTWRDIETPAGKY